jgi:hypothetical protein
MVSHVKFESKASSSNTYFISIVRANLVFIFRVEGKMNLQILRKRRNLSAKLHGVTSQKRVIFVYHRVQISSKHERRAKDISGKQCCILVFFVFSTPEIRPLRFLETSGMNHPATPCQISKERRPQNHIILGDKIWHYCHPLKFKAFVATYYT